MKGKSLNGISKRSLSPRAKKALKRIAFGYSRILDVYEDHEFCEFTLYEGGDVVVFRVYADGRVYER